MNNNNPTKQPRSSYSTKIKQTLRQLNANKIRQYQKINQSNKPSSISSIKQLQINNTKNKRTQQQKKLINKAIEKIMYELNKVYKKKYYQTIQSIQKKYIEIVEKDYKMARKYRMFRIFSKWTQITQINNKKKQKNKKQKEIKENQGLQMAKEFFNFITTKKVIKLWKKFTKEQKKSRKYQQEIIKVEVEQHFKKSTEKNISKTNKLPQIKQQKHQQNTNQQPTSHLQHKLRGFLDGLKDKIQNKNQRLHTIKQRTEQSKNVDNEHKQLINQSQQVSQFNQNNQHNHNQNNEHEQNQPQSLPQHDPKKPLTNQQLQKRRKQLSQRSKQRKQALQKLKKQKQQKQRKQQLQRYQLQRQLQQQQKKRKNQQYLQYQRIKKLQKQWEQKQSRLNKKADEFNKIRRLKYFGVLQWKKLKLINQQNCLKLKDKVERVLLKHLATEFIDRLQQNMDEKLNLIYRKMQLIHNRNLKRKTLLSFKYQLFQIKQQKIQLQAFHQAHIQKIFFNQWSLILGQLRLENIQQQRPLIKRANEYRRVLLLMKALKILKQNAKQSKKQKNIAQQKQKIKSKIKNIISQKIQINYDDFL